MHLSALMVVRLLRYLAVVLLAASAISEANAATSKTMKGTCSDPKLGITFPLPSGWSCQKVEAGFEIFEGSDPEPFFHIEVVEGNDPERLNPKRVVMPFSRKGEDLVMPGSGRDVVAQPIEGSTWQGHYAVAPCATADELGVHAGAGSCLGAILTSGTRSAILVTEGTADTDVVYEKVIKNFSMDYVCMDGGNQQELNACADDEFKKADTELNAVYKALRRQLSTDKNKALLTSQRSWLKQRDPRCKKDANEEAEGGSMWPMVYSYCLAEATRERTHVLRAWKK